MKVEIKEIPGYKGYYISNTGVVFSTKNKHKKLRRRKIYTNPNNPKERKLTLSKNNKTETINISKLLAITFIEPYITPKQLDMTKIKPIPDYPGYYASTEGDIYSTKKNYDTAYMNSLYENGFRKLKPMLSNRGYYFVNILGQKKNVHQLILLTFVGQCPEGMEVCHNNGKYQDNSLSNLRYDTRKANVADSIRHGTKAIGIRSGSSRLTEAQVKEIRFLYILENTSYRKLAAQFNVSHRNIGSIINRETWKHV